MKIIKKNITDNAVGAQQARLENNSYLRARNAGDSADVNLFRLNATNILEFPLVPQITATPSNNNDIATVAFVKSYADGLRDPKDAVRAASDGSNVALTGGATLTVDGVSMANGDRLLLKDQTDPIENGIYTVSGIGSTYALTRATDFDEDAEVTQGANTFVVEGTLNIRTGWMLSTADPITVDTTALTFVRIPIPDQALFGKDNFTLNGTDISNGYVDLSQEVKANSLHVLFGGLNQVEGTDYTLSVVSNVTRVTFAGDLLELASGDFLATAYSY